MRTTKPSLMTLAVALTIVSGETIAQQRAPLSVCPQNVYAALRPLPKLVYDCPESLTDSDDQLLSLPERRSAIEQLVDTLKAFNDPRWWQASVKALNVCDFRGSAGSLTAEEKGETT